MRTLQLSSVTISLKDFLSSLPLSLEKLSLLSIKLSGYYNTLILLNRLVNLHSLELCNIDKKIRGFRGLFRLQSLRLEDYELSETNIEKMKFLKNLRHFEISNELKYSFPFADLDSLRLTGKIFSSSNLLTSFVSLSKLQVLDLDFDNFTNNALDSVGELTSLNSLNISYRIKNGLRFSFQSLRNNKLLRSFTLTSSHEVGYGVCYSDYKSYSSFPTLPNLISFELMYLNIDDQVFELFPHFPKVRHLNLYGCRNVTNQSVQNINKKFPSLTHLSIKYTSITDLTNLLGHDTLRYINESNHLKLDKRFENSFIFY